MVRKDVKSCAPNQAAWAQTHDSHRVRSSADQHARQEAHAPKANSQTFIRVDENLRQILVFIGVGVAVGFSGYCANQAVVATTLALCESMAGLGPRYNNQDNDDAFEMV